MATRTHYDVLGIGPGADEATVRSAYRRLARDHHPDRVRGSAVSGSEMPAINEAYRVLSDPGRRAIYDRSVVNARATTQPAASPSSPSSHAYGASEERWNVGGADPNRPARVPWRTLLVAGTIAIAGVVALAQFSGIDENVGPDGILRNGDCVEIQVNGDAREVSCTGEADLVVRAFIPFDGTCPGLTEPHRDRQGMGVACIDRPD